MDARLSWKETADVTGAAAGGEERGRRGEQMIHMISLAWTVAREQRSTHTHGVRGEARGESQCECTHALCLLCLKTSQSLSFPLLLPMIRS